MMAMKRRWWVVVLALHFGLLACYTLPEAWVPERLQVLSGVYVRPLFHQQWRLFAPDPPRCSGELQVAVGEDWQPVGRPQDHYLVTRMTRSLADYAGGQEPLPDTLHMDARLGQAMQALVRDMGREVPVHFRLVQQCVPDDARPLPRDVRIIPVVIDP